MITLLTALLIGCAPAGPASEEEGCAAACSLLHHGGAMECEYVEGAGDVAGTNGYERQCLDLCVFIDDADDQGLDGGRDDWSACVLDRQEGIQSTVEEYGEASDEECAAAFDECGAYPCADAMFSEAESVCG